MTDIQDRIAQKIWECYAVEVGRSLPEGCADRIASAVVAELGLTQEFRTGFQGSVVNRETWEESRYTTGWEKTP